MGAPAEQEIKVECSGPAGETYKEGLEGRMSGLTRLKGSMFLWFLTIKRLDTLSDA